MIYVIQAGESDQAIKVGWTDGNPWARMRELQTGNAYRLRLLGFYEASRSNEAIFHKLLAPVKLEGEWFAWCGLVERFVRALVLEQAGLTQDGYQPMSVFIHDAAGLTDQMSNDEKQERLAEYGIGFAA